MGCASSKQKVCRNCQGPYSPVRRSYSMHVHHPPQRSGDSYHLVSLTSSTLGSLQLDQLIQNWEKAPIDYQNKNHNQTSVVADDEASIGDVEIVRGQKAKEEFAVSMIEAKTWSNMINEKIPKLAPRTPIQTPPGEPESINAWEMMEGLQDISPLRPTPNHFRSFSFHAHLNSSTDDQSTPRVKEIRDASWLDLASDNPNGNSIISEFNPEIEDREKQDVEDSALEDLNVVDDISTKPHGTEKLIMFYTSLRGVRKTYEDCCHVRVILKGLGVKVDDRDVSMHSGFKDELKDLLGANFGGVVGLPRVFLGKKYIGGADEIRRLNEEGTLEKLVQGCELVQDCGVEGGNCIFCEACGDIRFIPCQTCSGSCKIFYEAAYDEQEEEEYSETEHEYGFQRCPDCNENGLVRCPVCCN